MFIMSWYDKSCRPVCKGPCYEHHMLQKQVLLTVIITFSRHSNSHQASTTLGLSANSKKPSKSSHKVMFITLYRTIDLPASVITSDKIPVRQRYIYMYIKYVNAVEPNY